MLKENESVLGLDIESQGIKIVELKKTTQGIELVQAKILPIPADCLKEGVIVEPKSIGRVLKEFIEANNILTRKAVAVMEPSLTLLRLLRIPFMSEEETKTILETEANQYVDFKHKAKVIDFCLLEEISEEGIKKVNVLFAASLKEAVNAFIQIAEEADLELIGIDVSALAIIRTLYGTNIRPSSLEPVMLVIIDKENIQLCILKSNRLRFLHAVKIDIKEFITARQEFIERLIFSIKLALNFYSRAIYGQEEIQRIIVNINKPSLKDIDKELVPKLEGLSVEKAEPLARLKVDNTLFSESAKEEIGLAFTPLIGAALRPEDSVDYPLSLNLIPPERQQRLLINKELNLYASSLTVLLTIFVVSAGFFGINNLLIERRINELNRQLEETTVAIDKLIQEGTKSVDLNKRINEASQIITEVNKNRYVLSSSLLAKVMVLVPEGLWLTDISGEAQEKSLNLAGNALGEKYIFEYVNSLVDTGHFNKVDPVFSKSAEATLHFLIKCQLKR